ncbi:hypothetical protein [Flavobacterium sp.]|jgi:hypothetical protein|uniref:hypothetical protein n=1 Tax=Flavobacterium sp. TaxID=239 RepID=UPI0037C0B9A7
MNASEIEVLERYFQTKNEHWNSYTREILCEVMQQGNFENPEIPLRLFSISLDIFQNQHRTPLKAVQEYAAETDKLNLTIDQKLFVNGWVSRYLNNSEFDDIDTSEIQKLLRSQTEKLKNEKPKIEHNKPLTGNIRDTLKEMIQKEITSLPDTLKELDPVQRLNIICKLIPYVLPKVESVTHTQGEPINETESNGAKWQVP